MIANSDGFSTLLSNHLLLCSSFSLFWLFNKFPVGFRGKGGFLFGFASLCFGLGVCLMFCSWCKCRVMEFYGRVLPKLNWEEGRDIVLFLDRACVPVSLVLVKMIFLQFKLEVFILLILPVG